MKSLYSFILSLNNFLQIMFINKKFKEVVIFSENHRYYYVFFELIEKLKKENKNFIYVTSDKQDTYDFDNLGKCFYIGKGLAFILFVNFISCKNLIMTLTDLKNNKFKKSLFCKNFIYIFHSLMSTHKTSQKVLSIIDIIFACGQYQKDEIRKREKLKKLKRKTVIVSGYLYLDYLNNYKNKFNLNNKEKTILIAPSWNMDGKDLINNNIENIIEKILEKYNVILRPHPESFKRSESKLKDIQKKFSRNKKFKLDTNSSNVESMALSDILMTDGSGISMEFLFYKKQPVIYLETENLRRFIIQITN